MLWPLSQFFGCVCEKRKTPNSREYGHFLVIFVIFFFCSYFRAPLRMGDFVFFTYIFMAKASLWTYLLAIFVYRAGKICVLGAQMFRQNFA